MTAETRFDRKELPWILLRCYDVITRKCRHSLIRYSGGSNNLTRRNAIGYFDNLKASWTSMQRLRIYTSIESFSKQSPHETRLMTPWKRIARSKRCLMNSKLLRHMTISGYRNSRNCTGSSKHM